MKQPQVGETLYAFANAQNRVGETEFLCSTQENATTDLQTGYEDFLDALEEEDSFQTSRKKLKKTVIIYEMRRIA